MTKTAEKPYPLGTYLYSPYKGVPPGPSSPQARSFARLLACSLVRSRRLEKERKQLLRGLFDTQMKTAIKLMNRWIDKLKRGMLQIVTKTLNQAELVIIQCTFYDLFVEYDLRSKKKLVLCLQRVVETRVKERELLWEHKPLWASVSASFSSSLKLSVINN